jgi:molybdopterin-guanine dinucleotide biosynthesis protein A
MAQPSVLEHLRILAVTPNPFKSRASTAVVLGGGQPGDALAAQFDVPVKALLPIGDEPMAASVLRTLKASGVDRIVYIGPTTPELEPLIDVNVPARGSMLENLRAGLAAIDRAPRVLVATADIPLLTPEALNDVLERDPGVGLVYPVVPKAAAERMFPGGKRTYARVAEGTFTGGNLFLLEPGLVDAFLPRLEFILDNRKNVPRLASMFGFWAIIKLALGILTIGELERTVSKILGVPAQALITQYAEIGFDVDKPEDLELVKARLLESTNM